MCNENGLVCQYDCTILCSEIAVARTYTLRRRAGQQAETRLRIVEAAVALHSEVGPAQTTVSMVAERAGVQRHTVYAHFPDDRSLQLACSGLSLERDPLPDIEALRRIADGAERLRKGLGEIYAWYARNADLAASVTRDAEFHAVTRETVTLRIAKPIAALAELLSTGLGGGRKRLALTKLALSFATWRELTREGGLTQEEAIDVMARSLECAAA